MSRSILTDQRIFAYAQTIGVFFFLLLGSAAGLAVVIGALWLVAQFVLLVVFSLAEIFAQIGQTWLAADPFVRLLMLVCIAVAGYWIAKRRYAHARP